MAANDYLSFQQGLGANTTVSGISGTDYWAEVASTSLSTPVHIVFATNSSIGGSGFIISKLHYCGVVSGATSSSIVSDRRYQGILLGTNDTVYLAIAGAGTGTQLNIAAWAGPSGPADFDIYARCGSLPTPTVWQARSNHGGNEEFLTISNAQCGPASVLYVAVNSFNGSGGFNIMASRMNTTANKSLKVAVEGASPADLTAVVNTLRVGARMLYGASDGQVMVSQLDVVNVANGTITNSFTSCRAACQPQFGANCNVCYIREVVQGHAEVPGGVIIGRASETELGGWGDSPTIYHEWGHALLGVLDEYTAGTETYRCGHSSMADQWQMPNFCMDVQYGNHNLDRESPAIPVTFDSVWTEGLLLHADPGVTPDWYNFGDHDFAGNPTINTF